MVRPFRKGDKIKIKAEYQDVGDDLFTWVTTDDEEKGRVTIMALTPVANEWTIRGTQVVRTSMIEHVEN